MAIAGLRNLCTPAYVYFVISIITFIVLAINNAGYSSKYCIGSYTCDVASTKLIFVIKLIYILFWTWILNLMCSSGATTFAWFLVLLPFVLFFTLIASMMVYTATM